jgi:hypothetical protein
MVMLSGMKDLSSPAAETAMDTAQKLKGVDIELPEAPDFVSVPPRVPLAAAIRMNEELLPRIAAHPELERRARERVTVPFEL